jgi:hypothetical protein
MRRERRPITIPGSTTPFLQTSAGSVPPAVEHEPNHTPDYGKNSTMPSIGRERGWIPGITVNGPVKPAAHEGTDDAQQNGPQDAQWMRARYQQAGNESHNEAAQRPT